jgi:uncharacterized membrane protein YhaH (DUF805 family)
MSPVPSTDKPAEQGAATGEANRYGELRFFTLKGRLGRVRYTAWLTLSALVTSGIGGVAIYALFVTGSLLGWLCVLIAAVATIAMTACFFALTLRRLHDLNQSGWWMLVLLPFYLFHMMLGVLLPSYLFYILFSVIDTIFFHPGNNVRLIVSYFILLAAPLFLCLMPGNDGENRYGPPPQPNSNGVIGVLVVTIMIYLALILLPYGVLFLSPPSSGVSAPSP